jgi:hypothetical protein
VRQVIDAVFPAGSIDKVVEEIAERQIDPYSAADRVVRRLEVK